MSCQDQPAADPPATFDREGIIGKWVLTQAMRNGKHTESLKDAYFQFHTAHDLTTNVFGEDTDQQIIWSDSIATVIDSSMHYKVDHLQDDTLVINFGLQRYVFDLTLVKDETNDSLTTFAPSIGSKVQ